MRHLKTILFLSAIVVAVWLVVPLVTRAVTSITAPNNGLVGYWSFDEGKGATAYDYSGNKNTGVLTGSPKPSWLNGVLGKALSFNGSTAYINAGNKTSLRTFNDITISSWVKFNGIDYVGSTGKLVMIMAKGSPDSVNSTTGFWLSYDNRSNGHGFGYTCFGNSVGGFAGGGNNFAGYTYTFSNNVWYHISVTIASSQAKLFINGVQLGATKTFSNLALSNTGNSILIGGTYYLNGGLDEMRLYNRALSDTEIANLYKAGAAKVNSEPSIDPGGLDSGLVGYYTMDNQDINWTAKTMIDKSGATTTTATLVDLGSATSTAAGKFSQAIKMISSSTYIVAPPVSVGVKKTVSVWAYQTGPTNTFVPLAEQGGGGVYGNFRLIKYGTVVGFGYDNVVNNFYVSSSTVGTLKKWYHIVGVYDGVAPKIYVNGVLITSVQSSGNYGPWGTNTFNIGYRPYTSYVGGWNGLIDDVRVYNRDLSASEVKQLYNQGAGAKIEATPVAKPLTLDSGLVGYYTMNNQDINWATKRITDKSGSGNTGTLISMSATTSPVAGKLGQGLKLNGLNSTVYVGSTSSLKYAGGNMTISTWFFVDKNESTGGDLISKPWNGCGEYNYRVLMGSSRKFYVYVQGATGYSTPGGTNSVTANKWHHIVVRLTSAKNIQIYIDGVLELDKTHAIASWVAPSCGDNNISLDLGSLYPYGEGWVGNTGFSFGGAIDETRIYNRALSDAEIKQLYTQSK